MFQQTSRSNSYNSSEYDDEKVNKNRIYIADGNRFPPAPTSNTPTQLFVDEEESKEPVQKKGENDKSSKIHVTQKGDTYYSLAKKYKVSIKELREWNGYKDNEIPVGAEVIVSPPSTKQENMHIFPYKNTENLPYEELIEKYKIKAGKKGVNSHKAKEDDKYNNHPGVTFLFAELEAGAGLGYGLNYIEQSGIAWDEVGKTHFTLSSFIHGTNQNIEEGEYGRRGKKPQYLLGASLGLTGGITQNWDCSTFNEFAGGSKNSYSVPTGKPKIKAKFGVGVSANLESFTLSAGLQAGAKFSTLSTSIKQSISLTNKEADIVNDATDVWTESWIVNNQDYEIDKSTWSATVAVKNTKGEIIDTGIKIYSKNKTDKDGINRPSGIWNSQEYLQEAEKAEKVD